MNLKITDVLVRSELKEMLQTIAALIPNNQFAIYYETIQRSDNYNIIFKI